jgi:hypothetical protein
MWVSRILFVITNQSEHARFNMAEDWSVAQRAPVEATVRRDGLGSAVLPRLGPGDF